jgi:hypothetical protein
MAYATIELCSGTQFILQHEHDHPQAGVWLIGRIDSDPDKQRAEFVDALWLEPSDYRWIKHGDRWLDARTGEPAERRPMRSCHVANSDGLV